MGVHFVYFSWQMQILDVQMGVQWVCISVHRTFIELYPISIRMLRNFAKSP